MILPCFLFYCPLGNPGRFPVVELVKFDGRIERYIQIREPRTNNIASERGNAHHAVGFKYVAAITPGILPCRPPEMVEFGDKRPLPGNFDRNRETPEPDDIHSSLLASFQAASRFSYSSMSSSSTSES